jgi:uncharacterized protein
MYNLLSLAGKYIKISTMTEEQLKKLNKIFKGYPELKIVYLFGSRVSGKTGPLSDYDFALYIGQDKLEAYHTSVDIAGKIRKVLKTDNIDTVVLNHTDAPEIKYSIIKNGRIIYEVDSFRVLIEPGIMNEYFDFRFLLRKHGLTRA